jgi:hypothetical protein
MGEAGENAEVVDERLWNDEDKDAADGGQTEKEKYEKGSAVQTKPEDELEFRGAEPDAQEQKADAPEPGADEEHGTDDKSRKPEEASAKDHAGEEAPLNEMGDDDVEEAHGIQPEGAPNDNDGDADDAPAGEEQLELPQDLGLPGEDGSDAELHDADAGDAPQELGGDASGDDADEEGTAGEALDEMDEDAPEDADAPCVEREAPSVAPDSSAAAQGDMNQGQQAGAGRGGGGADAAPPPPDTLPEANAPTVAPSMRGTRATATAGAAADAPEVADMDEGGPEADAPDAAAAAAGNGGGGGSAGGSGEATGGSSGRTAPADKPLAAGEAPPSRRTPAEPNPYRNLGDALKRWRERLSVRCVRSDSLCRHRASVLARVLWAQSPCTPAQDPPDGCHSYLLPNTLIFPNHIDDCIFALTGRKSASCALQLCCLARVLGVRMLTPLLVFLCCRSSGMPPPAPPALAALTRRTAVSTSSWAARMVAMTCRRWRLPRKSRLPQQPQRAVPTQRSRLQTGISTTRVKMLSTRTMKACLTQRKS